MKRKLICLISAGILLSGCSSYHKKEPVIQTTVVTPMEQSKQVYNIPLKNEINSNKTSKIVEKHKEIDTTEPQSSLNLTKNANIIKAKINTSWYGYKQGSVRLKWISPTKKCASNTIFITKYKESNSITTAKKKIPENCMGTWKAEVLTKNGTLLATDTIKIQNNQQKLINSNYKNTTKNYTTINHWQDCASVVKRENYGYSREACIPKEIPKTCNVSTLHELEKSNISYC